VGKIVLDTTKLVKSYTNGEKKLNVLTNLTLKVKSGEIITIMGQSGAGKTTLLNILGTLDQPDSGQLTILGNNAMEMSDKKLSKLRNQDLGFVFQFHHLLPEFTAFENVLMPAIINNNAKAKEELADELFHYVHLSDRKDHLPAELSGGERLRVAVLRAFINQPALVLADEPTGNLDSVTSGAIMRQLKELNEQGQTIVLVTHERDIAGYAKRQVHLKDGMIEKDFLNDPVETMV